MTQFKSILVATDFSDNATHAVRKAALLAEHHAARLTMLHVVNPAGFTPLKQWFGPSIDADLKAAQARATLRQLAAEINGKHGVPARFRVVIGESFDEILRATVGADLLVLGQRGSSRVKDMVIGSTAERLLRLCRTSLLIVKEPLEGPYRNILVPVDFTASSPACLRFAAGLAGAAKIHMFHALDSTDEFRMHTADVPATEIRDRGDIVERDLNLRMRGMAMDAGVESARLSTRVRRGPAWACTLAEAEMQESDLIVVGRHGASTVARFLLGHVTRRLMAASTCDLMVLPRAAVAALRPSRALVAQGHYGPGMACSPASPSSTGMP